MFWHFVFLPMKKGKKNKTKKNVNPNPNRHQLLKKCWEILVHGKPLKCECRHMSWALIFKWNSKHCWSALVEVSAAVRVLCGALYCPMSECNLCVNIFFQFHGVWWSSPLPSSLLLCNPGFRSHLLHFAAKLKHPAKIIMHLLHILPLSPRQRSNASIVQVY